MAEPDAARMKPSLLFQFPLLFDTGMGFHANRRGAPAPKMVEVTQYFVARKLLTRSLSVRLM